MNLFNEWRGSFDGRPTMWIRRLVWIPVWRRRGRWLSFRVDLHKMVRADDAGCFHTHPAHAIRVVLWGGYVEEVAFEGGRYRHDGKLTTDQIWIEPGHIGHVPPKYCHRVERLPFGNSYSLWFRAPISADVKLIGPGWPADAVSPFPIPRGRT